MFACDRTVKGVRLADSIAYSNCCIVPSKVVLEPRAKGLGSTSSLPGPIAASDTYFYILAMVHAGLEYCFTKVLLKRLHLHVSLVTTKTSHPETTDRICSLHVPYDFCVSSNHSVSSIQHKLVTEEEPTDIVHMTQPGAL